MCFSRRFVRDFLLTRSTVEVCPTVDVHCIVFTNFLSIVKIYLSGEQRPVAMEDSVSVVSLTFMLVS